MENVTLEYKDDVGEVHSFALIVYDIQDRLTEGRSKATLMMCSVEFINNAAIKLSKRFGPGEGKQIDQIVKEDLLQKFWNEQRDYYNTYKINFFYRTHIGPHLHLLLGYKSDSKGGSGKNSSAELFL